MKLKSVINSITSSKRIKKNLALCLSGVLFVGSTFNLMQVKKVQAESGYSSYMGSQYAEKYGILDSEGIESIHTNETHNNPQGARYYRIDKNLENSDSELAIGLNLTRIGDDDTGFTNIAENYSKNKLTYEKFKNYIFHHLGGSAEPHVVKEAGKKLTELLVNGTIDSSCNISVPKGTVSLTATSFDRMKPAKTEGDFSFYGPFTVTMNRFPLNNVVNLSVNNGCSLTDEKFNNIGVNDSVDVTQSGIKPLYIKVPNDSITQGIVLTVNCKTTDPHVRFFSANAESFIAVPYVTESSAKATITLGDLGAYRDVTIKASDDAGNPVEGAIFRLRSTTSGGQNFTFSTGIPGIGTYNDVPTGEYIVENISVPSGYVKCTKTDKLTVNSNGSSSFEFVIDRKTSPVEVKVVDEEGNPIKDSGILFESEGQTERVITDENGIGKIDLRNGVYTVTQENVPATFVKSDEKKTLTLTDATESESVSFTNTFVKGSVSVKLIDDKGTELSGGKFSLYSSDGEKLGSYDNNGENLISSLKCGEYYLQADSSPDTYRMNDSKFSFTVGPGALNQSVSLTFVQNECALNIKFTTDDGLNLPGIVVVLNGGEEPQELTSDNNGEIQVAVKPGNYIVNLKDVPESYKVDAEQQNISVFEDGEVGTGEFKFTKIKADINVIKNYHDSDKLVSGAKYVIYDSEEKEVGLLITGNDDSSRITLPYGSYRIKEIASGEQSDWSEEREQTFEIKNEEPQTIKFVSKKPYGSLLIDCYKSTSYRDRIEGAQFDIVDSKGEVIEELITNENGFALMDKIELGKYYLQEVSTSDDCRKIDTKFSFSVNSINDVVSINVVNSVKVGSITLGYTDEDDGSGIAGAGFGLFNSNTNEMVDIMYTNALGIATFKYVPYGCYYVKMVVGANGYEKIDEVITTGSSLESKCLLPKKELVSLGNPFVEKVYANDAVIKIDESNPNISIGTLKANVDNSSTEYGQGSIALSSNTDLNVDQTPEDYRKNTVVNEFNLTSEFSTEEEIPSEPEKPVVIKDSGEGKTYTLSPKNTENGDEDFKEVPVRDQSGEQTGVPIKPSDMVNYNPQLPSGVQSSDQIANNAILTGGYGNSNGATSVKLPKTGERLPITAAGYSLSVLLLLYGMIKRK
jgi:hypothetical protein